MSWRGCPTRKVQFKDFRRPFCTVNQESDMSAKAGREPKLTLARIEQVVEAVLDF